MWENFRLKFRSFFFSAVDKPVSLMISAFSGPKCDRVSQTGKRGYQKQLAKEQ